MKVEKNEYKVSMGNQMTLELLPKLMKYEKWRNKLRGIVLDFITEEETKQFVLGRKHDG